MGRDVRCAKTCECNNNSQHLSTRVTQFLAMSSFNLPNRPSQPVSSNRPPPPRAPPLAPGWTEHKAPTGEHPMFRRQINIIQIGGNLTISTGHSYYYSAATKTSTYTRPVAPASAPFAVDQALGPYPTYALPHGSHGGGFLPQQYLNQQQFPPQPQFGYGQSRGRGGTGRGGRFDNQNPRQQKRQERPDRPKSKY